jgi:endothelin-converting enzyme/putative endopeptidase
MFRSPLRPFAALAFSLCGLLAAPPALGQPEQPLTSLPYSPSLNLGSLDTDTAACQDFYQFACGGWIESNPIPDDQSRVSTYGKLYRENQQYLWGVLEDVARPEPGRNSNQALLGDYYAACMDVGAIDVAGLEPVRDELALVDALTDKSQVAATIGRLLVGLDVSSFFVGLGSQQDARDSTRMIGAVFASGIGLPDRDYYLDDSERMQETRARYRQHIEAMFILAGESADDAGRHSKDVMRIETALAAATLTRVDRRDPHKVYNRHDLGSLQQLSPDFDWPALFRATGFQAEPWLNVTEPAFIGAMQELVQQESLESLAAYLRWGVLHHRAPLLSQPWRDEHFAFYSAYLEGAKAQPPRWRHCVSMVDHQLGEALGREFVERNFPPELRDATRRMSREIKQAMAERIAGLDWMGPQTREQALAKLQKVRDKIGYPDRWRDYSAVRVERDDFLGNVRRATAFDFQRQLQRIGRPVDKDEWFMTPATVNAYYNPSMNDINFPAGVLMPPLYDPRSPDAANYGNTGGTIGHELVHGFDDEGRKYDGDGNLRDWWTAEDAQAFEEGAECIRNQYAAYHVIDDIYINSELTSGEDIADLAGVILAWHAWRQAEDRDKSAVGGYTPEQQFFIGFAQWACASERPESLRLHAATDPHSPPRYRINGVVENMPEFRRAFACKAGDPMVRAEAQICRIW